MTAILRQGIIPAYAGSTSAVLGFHLPSRDHPRVCGEHEVPVVGDGVLGGSSPRMRGALAFLTGLVLSVGIIPAYAGSTQTHQPSSARVQDHPRVCGEHGP